MGAFDNNFIASYNQNKALRDNAGNDSDNWLGYASNMGSSIGGAALSGVQGVAGVLGTSLQMAQSPDTSIYYNQLDQAGMFRDGKTWDINQLMEQRNSIAPIHTTYEDIGGISDWGIAGGTLSAGAQGAMTGLQIGGPWGALIGGVIGTGAGLAGGLIGRSKAKAQVDAINMANKYQQEQNDLYFNLQADKIQDYQFGKLFANRAAEGGGIHIKKENKGKFTEAAKRNHMSVQEFAKHVLSAKNKDKYSATMRKRANFARNSAGWSHAEGGQLEISDMDKYNTHGGYYAPDNLIRINAGGTHEQNPYGGVQMGVDEQGIPNLVEENESIYNDYVFSDRLKARKSELKKFNLPEKYDGESFSFIADKLSAEAKDRPNDAVSANGMGAMLDRLTACQEYRKQKIEEARIRRELNRMSPEELMALGAEINQQQAQPMPAQMPMQQAQPIMEQPMMPQEQVMPEQQPMPVMACGGKMHKYDDGGVLLPYVEEDPTTRAMQHFDDRQARNDRIIGAVDTFFNGPDNVNTGYAPSMFGPLSSVARVGNTVRAAKAVPKVMKTAGTIGLGMEAIRLGSKLWGGLGDTTKTPVDNTLGPYSKTSTSSTTGGAYVDGYADGGLLAHRYDWPDYLGYGPITTSIYTPPQYEGEYSYFTNNPIHTTGKVEWVRHLAGQGAVPEVVVENPAAVEYDGPLMRDGRYAVTQTSGRGVSGSRGRAAATRTKVDALPSVAGRLAPGLVAAKNDYGYILPGPAATSKVITETPSGAIIAVPTATATTASVPTATATEKTTATGPGMLATWPRYAGAVGNAALAIYNAFQEPDRLNLQPVRPTFINGRLALDRQRYNPIDQQSMVNPVLANSSAGYRAINNSGMGPSTSAAMVAAMNAANAGIGAATTQGRIYNDQLRSGVTQQNNAASQAEADFYRSINTPNAQIANQTAMQNYYGNMRQQMYNNQQETAKWNAVSQALDAGLTDLSNIGRENFVMNQVNSNRALLGYWVDARGMAHYTTPEGREEVRPATEQEKAAAAAAPQPVRVSRTTAPLWYGNSVGLPSYTFPSVVFNPDGTSRIIR